MDGPQHRWRIDELLQRCNLAVLLDELATPADGAFRGRRWHCPLPAHDDHHPSVSMFTDHAGHQRWRCWSGDDTHRGDAIDLVMTVRHCSRHNAIEWLADRLDIQPDHAVPRPPPLPQMQPTHPLDPDPAVVRYVEMCERILWTVGGTPIRRWLAARGLDDQLLRVNRVGADPGRRLLPRRRGLPPGSTIAAVFPALDQTGTVRYAQARNLNPGNGPKYLNPAAELAANPRLAWTITTGPARPNFLIICEGIPDGLTAAQAGYQAVAVLGSNAPDHNVAVELAKRARRDSSHLVAVIDNDDAGHAWSNSLKRLLGGQGHPLSIVTPPTPGTDLNDWARPRPELDRQHRRHQPLATPERQFAPPLPTKSSRHRPHLTSTCRRSAVPSPSVRGSRRQPRGYENRSARRPRDGAMHSIQSASRITSSASISIGWKSGVGPPL